MNSFIKIFVLCFFLITISLTSLSQAPQWSWAKSMGSMFNYDSPCQMVVDNSGNVYVSGYFTGTEDFDPGPGIYNLTSLPYYSLYLVKLDIYGNLIWAKIVYNNYNASFPATLALSDSNNIFITGIFNSTSDFDPGPGVVSLTPPPGYIQTFISSLDSSGNLRFVKAFGVDGLFINSIAVDSIENIYITGTFNDSIDIDPDSTIFNLFASGLSDMFIAKLDSKAKLVWAKSLAGGSVTYSGGMFNYDDYETSNAIALAMTAIFILQEGLEKQILTPIAPFTI